MPNPGFIEGKRAERRAATKPAAHWRVPSTGRHSSAFAPAGDRQTYSFDEGLQ